MTRSDDYECPQHGVAFREGCDWCRLAFSIRQIAVLYDDDEECL